MGKLIYAFKLVATSKQGELIKGIQHEILAILERYPQEHLTVKIVRYTKEDSDDTLG